MAIWSKTYGTIGFQPGRVSPLELITRPNHAFSAHAAAISECFSSGTTPQSPIPDLCRFHPAVGSDDSTEAPRRTGNRTAVCVGDAGMIAVACHSPPHDNEADGETGLADIREFLGM